MMNQKLTKMSHFKKNESGYHESAKNILSGWVNGIIEQPFTVDGSFVFVPDITVYKDGVLNCIYEVVYSHPLSAKKYGLIQYWCYMNRIDLTVLEVSADWILKQIEKPLRIEAMECYTVSILEYEDELLIKSIS